MPYYRINIDRGQANRVFDASYTKAAAKRMIIKLNDDIAQEGVHRVKARLGHVLKHPTGRYESRIAVERRQTYRGVWDQRALYGGWLEGVDRRNRTSRFKGYYTFRLVKQSLQSDSVRLAEPAVRQFIREVSR